MLRWIKQLWKRFESDKLERERWEAQRQRIAQTSVVQAREEALRVLQDEGVFRLVPASGMRDTQLLAQLPEDVRELATQYDRVDLVGTEDPWRGADGLDFSKIGPTELREGYWRIGRLAPDTDLYTEIAVRPGEPGVYELYWTLGEPQWHRSVYHWLLQMYWMERTSQDVEEH
jgi:hypothetical protein